MSRKKRKKEKKEGYDPSTATDEMKAEGSAEVKEAEEQFDKEQQDAMTDLLDNPPEEPAAEEAKPDDKPPEKPAEQEPDEGQPQAKEPEPDEAKTEEQPPEQTPEAKAADVPESTPEKKPDEKPPEEPTFVSGDRFGQYNVEVVTDEGARSVPLDNLVTTYQQFGHLQQRYQQAKPIFDLAEKAGVRVDQALPLLELGIQTYVKQQGIVEGRQPPVGDAKQPQQQPAGYQGPFKDQEQDDYYKEVDPDMHATMHRMYGMVSQGGGSSNEIAQMRSEIEALKQSRSAPPTDTAGQQQAAEKAFNDIVMKWSGDHTDYFTAPNIGEARLNAFKNFIIRSHAKSGVKLKDLTNDFLAAEFARFDPRYNLEYMKSLASKKAAAGKQDSGMFAESSGVRSQAEPLDDQQKHMADLL